jgi:TetR/AcrR family transcriptional regulator, cholesterol catabolism regulator
VSTVDGAIAALMLEFAGNFGTTGIAMRTRNTGGLVSIAISRQDDLAQPSPTRTEILEAAARLIADRGHEGCTMRAIANEVKVKAGSLYYHFSSKDQIIDEVLNSGLAMLLQEVQGRLDELPKTAPFAERVEVAIRVHIACMVHPDSVYLRVYEYLPPVLKRRSRAMRKRYAELWFTLFRDGIDNREVEPGLDLAIFVPYFLGALNKIPEWFRHKKFREADVAALISSTLLRGVSSATPPVTRGVTKVRTPRVRAI